jgi:4-hydroxyphenylpyruvate dioxygenase
MNVVVNAHAGALPPPEAPVLAALALRVRDAAAAHARCVALGAWDAPAHVAPMELHIPAIHGAGGSRIYFADRWRDFSIYGVDFVPVPGVDPHPPALAGLHWFGIVQYIGAGRTEDWLHFYRELLGCRVLDADARLGVLPRGRVLQSPDGSLHLQLVEPEPGMADSDSDGGGERLQRVAFGAPDVPAAVQALRERGVEFVCTPQLPVSERGALARSELDGLMFELVRHGA